MAEHYDEYQQEEVRYADTKRDQMYLIGQDVLQKVEKEQPGLMQAEEYLHDILGLLGPPDCLQYLLGALSACS